MRRPPPLISFSEGLSQTSSGFFVAARLSASQSPSAEPTLKEPRHVPVKTGLCSALARFMSPSKERPTVSNLFSLYSSAAPFKNRIHYADEKSDWAHGSAADSLCEAPGSRRSSGVGDLPPRDVSVRVSANNHIKVWDD